MALVPDDWKGTRFDVWNLFVLSAAAALHDLGKAVDAKDDHGFISMTELRTRAQDFGLDDVEAEVVGWIVRPHNDGNIEALPQLPVPIRTAEVNVRQLAALFKLADALHTDSSRVSRQVTGMRGRKPEEDPKTLFRMRIRGWRFDEQDKIELYGVPKDWNETEILSRGVELTRRELETAAPILRQMGIPCEIVLRMDETDLKGNAVVKIREQRDLKRAWLGLEYFLEEDAPRFKGRKSDADVLWKSVMGSPIWLLISDSGVGKTSLIHAGLLPQVHRMGWQTVYARPFDQPDKNIIAGLTETFLKGKPAGGTSMVEVLAEAARAVGDRTILIILDQFEDVIRAGGGSALEGVRKMFVAVQAGRFRNIHVLVSYRSDAEATLGPLFQQVTGSNRGAPKSYLSPLDTAGTMEALQAGFATAQVGVTKELLEVICRDLETETSGQGIYPPYIQMVGETLSEVARQKGDCVLTEQLYFAEGSAKQIVGQYLFRQLESLGSEAQAARQVLVALVRSTGTKGQRSMDELKAETRLDNTSLGVILTQLVDRRMIRHLAGQQYEIAHDFLAQLVDRNIVSDDQRRLMALRELLEMKARAYPTDRVLLHPDEMAQLYVWRDSILPSDDQISLLLDSCLAGNGPAWVWLRQLEKQRMFSLLKERTKHERVAVRRRMVKLLARLAGHQAVPDLKLLLRDKNYTVRSAAALALTQVAELQDVDDLIALLRFPDHSVQNEATKLLARLAQPKDIPNITAVLKDRSSKVRRLVAILLAHLAGREGIPDLKALLKHKHRAVRSAAVSELGRVGGQQAIAEFKMLLEDRSSDVRQAAVAGLPSVLGRQAIPELKALMKNADPGIRWTARTALINMATHEDIPILLELFGAKDDIHDWEVKSALELVAEREDIPYLLKHQNPNVRAAGVRVLARVAGRQAIPDLKVILKCGEQKGNTQVYWAAKQAFVSMANREDIPDLLPLIGDGRYSNSDVIQAIARVASHQDISNLLKDKREFVREALLSALKHTPNREAVPDLKILLKDPNRYVRCSAVRALANMADRQYIPDIKALLQDKSSTVRNAATEALGQSIKCLDITELKDLLKGTSPSLRQAANFALVGVAGHQNMSELLDACGDPNQSFRQTVAEKLWQLCMVDDLTSVAQKAARYSAAGVGREAMCVLTELDHKFYAPFKDDLDEKDEVRNFWAQLHSMDE